MDIMNDNKIIPKIAYRYWPSGDLTKTGEGRLTIRYIFYKAEFSAFEIEQIMLFKSFISQASPSLVLPNFFNDSELLRIILGCKFNLKRSFEALQSSIEWREKNLRNSFYTLYPVCCDLLNSGTIYFHGRDHRFRPLLVLNLERFRFKEIPVDSYCSLLCFLLEFAIKKLMIPGQIENWIVITDLSRIGLTSLPLSDLKRLIKILQDNFRCRMIVNFVLNSPKSIYFIWNIAKKFIEEHTIKKIKIESKGQTEELFNFFNKSQVEEKYGGTAPNLTEFWPPVFPDGPLDVEGVSIERYLKNEKDTYFEYNEDPEVSSQMGSIDEGDGKRQITDPCHEDESDSSSLSSRIIFEKSEHSQYILENYQMNDSERNDEVKNYECRSSSSEKEIQLNEEISRSSSHVEEFSARHRRRSSEWGQENELHLLNQPGPQNGQLCVIPRVAIQPIEERENKNGRFDNFCCKKKCIII